jgi:hypothetical protein
MSACDKGPNYLEGSVGDSHNLTFNSVSLRYIPDQLVYQLAYFNSLESGGADTVAKITFNEPAGGAVANTPISLIAPEAGATIERITAGDDAFPPTLREGQFTFFDDPIVGNVVSGEFASTFEENGKTLNGGFKIELTECSFDGECT